MQKLWLTSPMQEQGSITHCVCVCVLPLYSEHWVLNLKAKARYHQKALYIENKTNVQIELKTSQFESCDGYKSSLDT